MGLVTFLINTAIAIGLNLIARAIAPKPKNRSGSPDFTQTIQRRLKNNAPLEVLVGRRIVAGVAAYDDVYGANNENGVSISILSAKPCHDFHKLFLDGDSVTLSGDPTQGEVFVTSHFLGKPGSTPRERVKVRIFLGDDNSGVGAFLNAKLGTRFASTDNFGDYCIIVVDCKNTNDDLDQDTGKNYIPFQGYPQVKVELSGAKVCDPRVTGYDYADETTYVYSDNSALIEAQYDYGFFSGTGSNRKIIVGNGYPTELMDIENIKSQADYCDDEDFTCAGLLRSGANDDQDEIRKTYNATRVELPASVSSIAHGNRSDAGTITMSSYPYAHISFYDPQGFSTEVYNEGLVTYSEPDENYGEKELPVFTKSQWGASINRQLSMLLLYVTDKVQAYKLIKQEVYETRYPSTVVIENLPFNFKSVKVGSIINVTNSDIPDVNSKRWYIQSKVEDEMSNVRLTLRERPPVEAYSYDPDTEGVSIEINAPNSKEWGDIFLPQDYTSPAVVSDVADDVSGVIAGTIELTDVIIRERGSIITNVIASDSNINAALTIASEAANQMVVTLNRSALTGASIQADALVTTPAAIVTASGGTAPYTYLWEKVSGHTGITITSANAASTTFSGTPGSGNILNGVFKCTVTDSASPNPVTRIVEVSVTMIDFS
jgi:hypothetical protein